MPATYDLGGHRRPIFKLIWTALACIAWAYACGGGDDVTAPPPPPPPPPLATSVAVAPDSALLDAIGATVQLTAEVRDQFGQLMAGAAVTWASGDPAVATVDNAGLVTAAGNGVTTVTAAAGAAQGTARIAVFEPSRATLAAFYEATGGANWTQSNGWLTGAPLGVWYGVEADSSGRVTGLSLVDNNLSGSIPPELGDLASLTYLDLGANDLSGSIPPELGNLASLTILQLAENDLSGSIPPELGNLASLATLSLHTNALTGALPESFLQLARLEVLAVGGTSICVPESAAFTAWLAGLQYHDTADLDRCASPDRARLAAFYEATGGANWTQSNGWLTGAPLGAWYGVEADISGRVTGLSLVDNNLSGSIPPELGDLASLTYLDLGANDLSGSIPPELGNLASLTYLDLGANDLSGSIPPELGNLASLTILDLGTNDLSGSIPPELGNLASLTHLSLPTNGLAGTIPPELGDLASLTHLDLVANDLSGSIPPELGNLASLTILDLGANDLSGSIPPELGNLASLTILQLDENDLSGSIPPELGNLASLATLSLHTNALTGAIPPELGNLASLTHLVQYVIELDRWMHNLHGSRP